MVTLSVLHVFVEYVKDTESIYAFKKKIWGVDLQHTIGSLSNKDKRHLKSEFEPLKNFWNFIAHIPSRSVRQMLAIFSGAEKTAIEAQEQKVVVLCSRPSRNVK